MKTMLFAAAAAALVSPASAANIAITLNNGAASVTESGTGTVAVGPEALGGVTVTLSTGRRITGPNGLSEANINIDNTTGTVQTLDMVVGAVGYLGHASEFKDSATVILDGGVSDLSGGFWVDPLDRQSGTAPGVLFGADIQNFNSGALTGPFSFSFNGFGFETVTGPYSLAEGLALTLQPGASVGVQGIAMTAIPEPATWIELAAGFAFVAGLGWRRRAAV